MFCETKPQLAVRTSCGNDGHNNALPSERKHNEAAVAVDLLICFKASVEKNTSLLAPFQSASLIGYLCLDETVSVPDCTEPVQPVQPVHSVQRVQPVLYPSEYWQNNCRRRRTLWRRRYFIYQGTRHLFWWHWRYAQSTALKVIQLT